MFATSTVFDTRILFLNNLLISYLSIENMWKNVQRNNMLTKRKNILEYLKGKKSQFHEENNFCENSYIKFK